MQYSAYMKIMKGLNKNEYGHQSSYSKNSEIFFSPQPVPASNSYQITLESTKNRPEKIGNSLRGFVPMVCGEPEKRSKQE